MPNKTEQTSSCPRCGENTARIIANSPVADAWTVSGCTTCFYYWRSTEPAYATDAKQMDPKFRIDPKDIASFKPFPAVPALLTNSDSSNS